MLTRPDWKQPFEDGTQEPSQTLLTLQDIARFLRTYAHLIGLCPLAMLMVGVVYLMSTSPSFTARAQLLIDPQVQMPLHERAGDAANSLDSAQVESQIAVLRSERIATMVVDQLKLLNDPELLGARAGANDAASTFLNTRKAIENLGRNLEIRRLGLSYAIDISYRSRDPDKAALIANAVAEAYVTDQLNTRASSARKGSEWLEERIDMLRRQMNVAALKVQEFKAKRDYRLVPRNEPSTATAIVQGTREREAPPAGGEAATLEELESTAATFRRIYESYLQAYTDSVQRQSFPVPNARVITPATRPLARSHPKSGLILAFCALVGLWIGIGAAVLHAKLLKAAP